ncbi:metallophosphoesterase [Dysgonomonas sp. 520]|uniref:metallophosphoesterase family protein n=1 Tax=Dysgonomonas sp. 520 TaxID=2302931 RepID=UPI0013D8C2A6|nr:metallophosphoesterase [Dysgonomonas sp. 520]
MNNSVSRLIFLCFTTFLSFSSCASDHTLHALKIGVVSDMHYLSENLMDGGNAIRSYSESSGRSVNYVPEILDQVLSDLEIEDLDVLLIPGDLTKDGEKQSLTDLSAKLDRLRNKGVRIFAVPGNHDINVPNPLGYKEESSYPVDKVDVAMFRDFLADEKDILDRDTASLSYVAELNDATWLIGIDGCLYKEYTTSTITAGRINPDTEKWIVKTLDDARKQNKTVIGMMHHGLVEHIMYQDMVFKQYLIDDWKRLANLFADKGMKAIFTGHFHANDITEFVSAKGNKTYDIETGALASYPFPYRIVTLDDRGMDVTTRNITSISRNEHLVEESKDQLRKIAERQAVGKINSFGLGISGETVNSIAGIAGNILLLHVAGDEVLTDELKQQLKDPASSMGQEVDTSENIQLDFYPADNNVRIEFTKQVNTD